MEKEDYFDIFVSVVAFPFTVSCKQQMFRLQFPTVPANIACNAEYITAQYFSRLDTQQSFICIHFFQNISITGSA
jgi:hypothetical protein